MILHGAEQPPAWARRGRRSIAERQEGHSNSPSAAVRKLLVVAPPNRSRRAKLRWLLLSSAPSNGGPANDDRLLPRLWW